jgi:hypothetical protein
MVRSTIDVNPASSPGTYGNLLCPRKVYPMEFDGTACTTTATVIVTSTATAAGDYKCFVVSHTSRRQPTTRSS